MNTEEHGEEVMCARVCVSVCVMGRWQADEVISGS